MSSDNGLSIITTQASSGSGRFVLEDKATSTTYPMAIYSASGMEIYTSNETGLMALQSENDLKVAADKNLLL